MGFTRAAGLSRSGGPVTSDAGGSAVQRDRGLDGSSPRGQVAEIQRTRLLAAAMSAMDEFGYADVTVAHITSRARISRRTFYDLFDNREDCLAAVLEEALHRLANEVSARGAAGLSWRERVRSGLWAILSLFDREPALARVCLVQTSRGEERMLDRRAEVFAQLAGVVDEGRNEGTRGVAAPLVTAEGLVGAACSIAYERVLKRSHEPLTGLLPELMSMIVLPYLGTAAARREQTRPVPSPVLPGEVETQTIDEEGDPLQGVPIRVTYRTVRVLHAVAENPGISNRAVGDQADVTDQGQISKLLARLERVGLLANSGIGHVKGEANAWRLTPMGVRVTQSIHLRTPSHRQVA